MSELFNKDMCVIYLGLPTLFMLLWIEWDDQRARRASLGIKFIVYLLQANNQGLKHINYITLRRAI